MLDPGSIPEPEHSNGPSGAPCDAAGTVFDRSFLPPARFELVVLSDTHYLLHPELQAGEWTSILEFPGRAERAFRLAGALGADIVAHLGDVTHEYPETGEASTSRTGAQAQFAQYGLRPHVAPGNMDIGDKPDPTSPANWVTPETLAAWDAIFGPSWFSFDDHGIHGVILNSNIMGGPLPDAETQRLWLEADLAAHRGERIFIFLHHPPFFVDRNERAFGMYNSLDEPARGWLLDLVERHRVEMLFAGHTHFVALNHLSTTRFFVAPSTTTSRAGLPEAFTVAPADLGRSDLPKLGFYLVRDVARDHGTSGATRADVGTGVRPSVHLIRTGADSPALDKNDPRRLVLTLPSSDLPASRLGVVATHPLGHMTPGPVIWPSVVRQRVRDDWRPMGILELGARHVRIPESDLSDASERSRLPVLRAEGVAVTAYWLWSQRVDLLPAVAAHRDVIDEVEVVYPGDALPHPDCLAQIAALRAQGLPVMLSTAIRATPIPPQYHGRTRIGFLPNELAQLSAWLDRHACHVDRVICRLAPSESPWDTMLRLRALLPLQNIGAVDFALDLAGQNEDSHAALAVEALFSTAALPDSHLWLAPLLDLDRSMDISLGLLDRLSNPRSVHTAARTLNTVLFAAQETTPTPTPFEPAPAGAVAGMRVLALDQEGRRLRLCLPATGASMPGAGSTAFDPQLSGVSGNEQLSCFHLSEGTSETVDPNAPAIYEALGRTSGPALLLARFASPLPSPRETARAHATDGG